MKRNELDTMLVWFSGSSSGYVKVAQTTFLDFVVERAGVSRYCRIHYKGKQRFSKISGQFASLSLHDQHPLCIPYEAESYENVMFSRGPADGESLLEDLQNSVLDMSEGWLSLSEFVNPYYLDGARLVPHTYGSLLDAPSVIVREILPLLQASGMKFRALTCPRKARKVKVLTLGSMYIVADDFRGEIVNGAA